MSVSQDIIVIALDALGIELVKLGYEWTPEMRDLYERAVRKALSI